MHSNGRGAGVCGCHRASAAPHIGDITASSEGIDINGRTVSLDDATQAYNAAIAATSDPEGAAKAASKSAIDYVSNYLGEAAGAAIGLAAAAAGGAALGSVVPLIGTAIGAVVGAIGTALADDLFRDHSNDGHWLINGKRVPELDAWAADVSRREGGCFVDICMPDTDEKMRAFVAASANYQRRIATEAMQHGVGVVQQYALDHPKPLTTGQTMLAMLHAGATNAASTVPTVSPFVRIMHSAPSAVVAHVAQKAPPNAPVPMPVAIKVAGGAAAAAGVGGALWWIAKRVLL